MADIDQAHRSVTDLRAKDNVFFGLTAPPGTACSLLRIAHEHWGGRFHAVRDGLNRQGIVLVHSGRGSHRSEGCDRELVPGTVFFFGGGVRTEFWCDADDPLEVTIIVFDGHAVPQIIRENVGKPNAVIRPTNAPAVTSLIRFMFATAKAAEPFARRICDQTLPVLLLTIRSGAAMGTTDRPAATQTYYACRRYIDRNFAHMASAGEAAEAAGITPEHMCRLFRSHANVTPHAYLLELRVNYAAHLLETTGQTVKDVATELGFSDAYSFSKTFKRVLGQAPSHYRKGQEKVQEDS